MINGAHVILYNQDAGADRDFIRDVLASPGVDAGGRSPRVSHTVWVTSSWAQVRRPGHVAEPFVQVGPFFAHCAGPQAVHEHSLAVPRRGVLIDPVTTGNAAWAGPPAAVPPTRCCPG
jgi:hypothetical protein